MNRQVHGGRLRMKYSTEETVTTNSPVRKTLHLINCLGPMIKEMDNLIKSLQVYHRLLQDM